MLQALNRANVPAATLAEAQKEVTRILRDIGVNANWVECPGALQILIVRDSAGALAPRTTTLGLTPTGQDGTEPRLAYVFHDRVEHAISDSAYEFLTPQDVAKILACAIVHEIGHLLLPKMPHASEGLMRYSWGPREFKRAVTGALSFDSQQARLIRDHLAHRTDARSCPSEIH